MAVTLELPYPPSVNRYWRVYRGRAVLSREGRQYRDCVFHEWQLYRKRERAESFGDNEVRFVMLINPPDRRRRDIDNLLKAVFDAIEYAGIIDDDSQVRCLKAEWGDCITNGRVVLSIERYGDGRQ